MAVSSLGLSEVARQAPVVGGIFKQVQSTASTGYKIAADVYTGGMYSTGTNVGQSLVGGKPAMALNIGGLLGSIGGILGNTNTTGNPYVGGLSGALNIASQIIPTASRPPAVMSAPTAQQPQLVSTALSSTVAVATGKLSQEIFNAGAKVLNKLGVPYRATASSFTGSLKRTLSSIAALARRTPGGTMVGLLAGLGLTAMEAYVLTAWQTQRRKHRRINPANSKALRRSVRRIKAFHRLCGEADVIKPRRRTFAKGCAKAC